MKGQRARSGIFFVPHNGLRWQDALMTQGAHKMRLTIASCDAHLKVFARIVRALARPGADGDTIMIV